MMLDVLSHLRAISAQQSKIRGLRNKLAILKEAAGKQEKAVSELLLVRRVPAVYRQCLADCMRRCLIWLLLTICTNPLQDGQCKRQFGKGGASRCFY
jgi:hypothetical protein